MAQETGVQTYSKQYQVPATTPEILIWRRCSVFELASLTERYAITSRNNVGVTPVSRQLPLLPLHNNSDEDDEEGVPELQYIDAGSRGRKS